MEVLRNLNHLINTPPLFLPPPLFSPHCCCTAPSFRSFAHYTPSSSNLQQFSTFCRKIPVSPSLPIPPHADHFPFLHKPCCRHVPASMTGEIQSLPSGSALNFPPKPQVSTSPFLILPEPTASIFLHFPPVCSFCFFIIPSLSSTLQHFSTFLPQNSPSCHAASP